MSSHFQVNMIRKTAETQLASIARFGETFPWIPVLVGIGIALRGVGLTTGAMWYDEAYSIIFARLNLMTMINALRTNVSPPGWEILLWFSTRLIGQSDLALRAISLMASLLILGMFCRLTVEWRFTRAQRAFGLALVALLPYQLWIAQEVRVYAVMSCLYLVGILWAWQGRYLGMTAVMGLLFWSHNVAPFYALAIVMLAMIVHPRDGIWIFLSGFISLLAWLAWMPVVLSQIVSSTVVFLPPALEGFTANFIFDLFASTMSVVGVPAALLFYASLVFILMTGILSIAKWLIANRANLRNMLRQPDTLDRWEHFVTNNRTWAVAYSFLMPLSLFIVTAWFRNTLTYRPLSALIPPLLLLLAVGLIPRQPRLIHGLFPVMWIGILMVALMGWSYTDRGSSLNEALNVIRREWQTGDVIYQNTDMTTILFVASLPDKPQYVMDAPVLFGGKGIIEAAQLAIPRMPLEQIPHRRVWLIWTHDTDGSTMLEADKRMSEYSRHCPLIDQIEYRQEYVPISIYLCGDPTQNELEIK